MLFFGFGMYHYKAVVKNAACSNGSFLNSDLSAFDP